MNALPNIDFLPTPNMTGAAGGTKSAGSKGKDVFQSILDSLNGKGSNFASTLYSDTNTKNSLNTELNSHLKNLVKGAGFSSKFPAADKTRKNNNPDDLLVPASLQNHLVMFLEKQGFSLKDINQTLTASKNNNGLIQLDKMLAGLSNISQVNNTTGKNQNIILVATFKESFSSFLNDQGIDTKNFGTFFSSVQDKNTVLAGEITGLLTGDSNNSSFIESSNIPEVQEILFKMGLGVGEVKKIIEQSKNGNGELELGKLSNELNKYRSSNLSESDLASILSKNDIPVSKHIFNMVNVKSDKDNLILDNSKYLTEDAQKELKQNIEAMLKENGVKEENITSLLEKLDTAFTKTTLEKNAMIAETNPNNKKILSMLEGEKHIISEVLGDSTKGDIAAYLKNKGTSDKDVKSFLDSFKLDIKNAVSGQGDNSLKSSLLNEKAFLLSNDQFSGAPDQGNLKLNLTELIKLAEKKADATQLSATESNTHSMSALKNSSSGKEGNDFQTRLNPELSGLNISQEKEIKNLSKVEQTNTSATLPDPLPKVMDKMIVMIRTGEYKSRLQITPPDLGKLDIDLTVKNGHIQANLSTENAAVKEIIEANLNQLKQQLNNHGLTVDSFDVMVGLDNGDRKESNTWAEGRNKQDSNRGSRLKSDNTGGIPVSSPVNKGLISDSQVDVHV